jgi:hypothetical protein
MYRKDEELEGGLVEALSYDSNYERYKSLILCMYQYFEFNEALMECEQCVRTPSMAYTLLCTNSTN